MRPISRFSTRSISKSQVRVPSETVTSNFCLFNSDPFYRDNKRKKKRKKSCAWFTATSEGKVRQWGVETSKTIAPNVHDEERSGTPGVQTDEIVQEVDEKLRSDGRLVLWLIDVLLLDAPLLSRRCSDIANRVRGRFRKRLPTNTKNVKWVNVSWTAIDETTCFTVSLRVTRRGTF